MPLNLKNHLGGKFCQMCIKRCSQYIKTSSETSFQLSMAVDSQIINKITVPLGENLCVITLLMADIVWKILIPQIYVDFRGWENRICRREILLNLIQTSENNK